MGERQGVVLFGRRGDTAKKENELGHLKNSGEKKPRGQTTSVATKNRQIQTNEPQKSHNEYARVVWKRKIKKTK